MEESGKSSGGTDWQRFLQPLIVILLGGLLALQVPLESKRPSLDKTPPASPGIQLDSRLWMDPFEAPRQDIDSGDKHNTNPDDLGAQILRHLAESNAETQSSLFLLILVDGSPNVESIERRRRIRYAVNSALLAANYHAEDGDHIRYFDHRPYPWDYFDPQDVARVQSQVERRMPDLIPYEWFIDEDPKSPDIGIFWIDESQLGAAPLTKLRVIKAQLRLDALRAIFLSDSATREERKALLSELQRTAPRKAGADLPCLLKGLQDPAAWAKIEAADQRRKLAGRKASPSELAEILAAKFAPAAKPARPGKGGKGVDAAETYDLGPASYLLQQIGPEATEALIVCLSERLARRTDIATAFEPALREKNYRFAILGPSSSDGLAAMLEDVCHRPDCAPDRPPPHRAPIAPIYSPTAAIAEPQLLRHVFPGWRPDPPEGSSEEGRAMIEHIFEHAGFPLVRTNPANDAFAIRLLEELDLRGIGPAHGAAKIALITEHDTLYGRSLAEAFATQPNPPAFQVFSYFRVLDGENSKKSQDRGRGDTGDGKGRSSSEPLEDLLNEVWPRAFELASGDDQIDYLRRIADKLERADASGGGPVRAIGLIGSDVYDKLLALRALRPRFPSAIFFTVGLDARLFDGTVESEISRNLLVASGFGLEPDHTDGARVIPPPFRSGEQTAYFETVGRIVTGHGGAGQPRVRLYEIGRTRLVELLSQGRDAWPWARLLPWAVLLLVIAGAGRLACPVLRQGSLGTFLGGLSMRIVAPLVLGFALLAIALESREPLVDPREGVSIWPTEFFRLLAVILGACFWRSAWRLAGPPRLSRASPGTLDPRVVNDFLRRSLVNLRGPLAHRHRHRFPWAQWLRDTAPLSTLLLLLTLGLQLLSEYARHWTAAIPLLALVAAALSQQDADGRDTVRPAQQAHREFRQQVYLHALLFSAVTSALMLLSPMPLAPYRGPETKWVDRAMLDLSVALFIGLLATVLVEGTRLFGWLRDLRTTVAEVLRAERRPQGLPPSPGLAAVPTAAPDPSLLPQVVLAIGGRSRRFFRLAWLPFIVAALLLLARNRIFDNWAMPVGLACVFILSFSLLFGCIIRTRALADDIRKAVLERLVQPSDIERVKNCNEGAFGPILTGPTIGGLALVAGGSSLPDLFAKLAQWLF